MVGPPKCLRNSGALEVVRESIPKIDAISFFADIEHKCVDEGHDNETLLQIGFLDECLTVVLGGSSCLRASPRWIAAASKRSPRLEFLV